MATQVITMDTFQQLLNTGGNKDQDAVQAMILAALAKLGGAAATEDDLVYKGKKFILPVHFENNIPGAIQYLHDLDQQSNKVHAFRKVFRYRPNDVAHALGVAMKKVFGTTGVGKETVGFFGSVTPPTFRTIDIGWEETAQVIHGKTAFSPLGAVITVSSDYDAEVGFLGEIIVEAPRKFRAQVEGLFVAIEDVLKTASIYRAKAINGSEAPGFLNVKLTDPNKAVYAKEAMRQLNGSLWSPIEHADTLRELGVPLKRAILLEGPYGTGKSMAAAITARKCVENGFTFIQVRPGDDLELAMKTARLYEPAVVFFEDVDVVSENGEPAHVSKLLDVFDGIAAKGAEIMVVFTTNHVEKIQKGMLRPGRMDAVIHIGAMDPDGVRKLIEANVDPKLMLDLDFDVIGKAFDGYLPAFAMEAIKRTIQYAVARVGGKPTHLTTDDFVAAADGLRPQLKQMEEATEGIRRPTLDKALRGVLREAMNEMDVVDSNYDFKSAAPDFKMREPAPTLADV
jgi:hypothetical protein